MNKLFFEILQDFTSFSKLLFSNEINAGHKRGIKGQTLVEFILLLFIIVFISTFFMKLVNHNIAAYWKYFVSVVVDDKTVRIRF